MNKWDHFDRLVIVAGTLAVFTLAILAWHKYTAPTLPFTCERGALKFSGYLVIPVTSREWELLTNSYPQFYTAASIKFK